MSGGSARARWRRVRAVLAVAVLRLLRLLLAPLGWRGAQRIGAALGWLGWRLSRRDRGRALEHLEIALPELTAAERRRLAKACFAHFGATLCECVRLLGADADEVRRRVRFEGWEHVEALRREGRPILILTGHCGNWELLAAALSCNGLPLDVVARQAQDAQLDEVLVGLRARFGTRTIARGGTGAARELLRTLRAGGTLGMLIDQDTQVEGAWVPFFGRPAYTPLGAAQIALRQGLAVVPTFIERRDDGSHLASVQPPLALPADAVEATAAMTQVIEDQVRRRPEQWVWMHRRWRRQPPAAAETSA